MSASEFLGAAFPDGDFRYLDRFRGDGLIFI
jgi:hypothetical protein